jgi:hypothetical protein
MTTATKAVEVGSLVMDPISGLPCRDKATGRPYIVGPDGKPVVQPVIVPPDAERVARLEDALDALAHFVVENQLSRFGSNLAASSPGGRVLEFIKVIADERAAREER